jgi:hypothetical protein
MAKFSLRTRFLRQDLVRCSLTTDEFYRRMTTPSGSLNAKMSPFSRVNLFNAVSGWYWMLRPIKPLVHTLSRVRRLSYSSMKPPLTHDYFCSSLARRHLFELLEIAKPLPAGLEDRAVRSRTEHAILSISTALRNSDPA